MSRADNEKTKAEISEWLSGLTDDPRVAWLLGLCVGRLLLREGLHWRSVAIGRRLEIDHVRDWLVSAVSEGARWLTKTDQYDRPKKLMKFGGFRELVAEADKAMSIAIQKNGQITLDPSHERIFANLEDGYVIVEMLSPAALDRESALMQHCIGNGGYDGHVEGEFMRLLSLRDPYGKPHATFLVNRLTSVVTEFQGKQNSPPDLKYMPYIQAFMRAERLRFAHGAENRIGMVEDIHGEWHELTALPESLETLGTLDMRNLPPCRLPKRLVVNGGFIAPRWMTEMPDTLHVRDNFVLGDAIPKFSEDFRAGNMVVTAGPAKDGSVTLPLRLDVENLCVEIGPGLKLPADFEVTGNFTLRASSAGDLPRRLVVGGVLDVTDLSARVWRGDIDCGGLAAYPDVSLAFKGNVRVRGDLRINGGDVTFDKELRVSGDAVLDEGGKGRVISALPRRIVVKGDLLLQNCKIGVMPRHLEVGGDLVLTDAVFDDLSGLRKVGGALCLEGTEVEELPPSLVKVGALMAAKSGLTSLPEGFTTKDNLILIGTPMQELPTGLKVGGNMFTQTSGITILPADAEVAGRILGLKGVVDNIDRSKDGRPRVRSLRR